MPDLKISNLEYLGTYLTIIVPHQKPLRARRESKRAFLSLILWDKWGSTAARTTRCALLCINAGECIELYLAYRKAARPLLLSLLYNTKEGLSGKKMSYIRDRPHLVAMLNKGSTLIAYIFQCDLFRSVRRHIQFQIIILAAIADLR